MPRKRKPGRPPKRSDSVSPKERLLRSAQELFYQKGMATGVDELSAHAKVSKMSLYTHFRVEGEPRNRVRHRRGARLPRVVRAAARRSVRPIQKHGYFTPSTSSACGSIDPIFAAVGSSTRPSSSTMALIRHRWRHWRRRPVCVPASKHWLTRPACENQERSPASCRC